MQEVEQDKEVETELEQRQLTAEQEFMCSMRDTVQPTSGRS